MRDECRTASDEATVDLRAFELMEVTQRGVGPDDVMNLGVIEREDDPEGTDDPCRLPVCPGSSVHKGLIDVSLHDGKLHPWLVAEKSNVCGRSVRRQDLQLDVCIGRDDLG